jgi:hypothetical protein
MTVMSVVEEPDEEYRLHLFTVDDPRLWEPRKRLSGDEIAIQGLTDEEWDTFHAIIAEV